MLQRTKKSEEIKYQENKPVCGPVKFGNKSGRRRSKKNNKFNNKTRMYHQTFKTILRVACVGNIFVKRRYFNLIGAGSPHIYYKDICI